MWDMDAHLVLIYSSVLERTITEMKTWMTCVNVTKQPIWGAMCD